MTDHSEMKGLISFCKTRTKDLESANTQRNAPPLTVLPLDQSFQYTVGAFLKKVTPSRPPTDIRRPYTIFQPICVALVLLQVMGV